MTEATPRPPRQKSKPPTKKKPAPGAVDPVEAALSTNTKALARDGRFEEVRALYYAHGLHLELTEEKA